MRQFGHVIGLVKFGWIDLVNIVGINFSLLTTLAAFRHLVSTNRAILALDKKFAIFLLLHNPSFDKCRRGILDPHISLPGKVVFALDASHQRLLHFFRVDKHWSKSTGCRARASI
jgi:hypothetical protein